MKIKEDKQMKVFGKKGVSTSEIVAKSIGILMIAIVIPIALNEMGALSSQINPPIDNGYPNENWGTSSDVLTVLLVTVVPILAVLGIAMKFI